MKVFVQVGLMLIIVAWIKSTQCQATWKSAQLTPEEEQRCCVDAHTSVLQISHLKSELAKQSQTIIDLRDELLSQISQLRLTEGRIAPPGTNWWTAANDIDEEGTWTWADVDHSFSFNHWIPGEPNDNSIGEDCGELWETYQFELNDRECAFATKFICEYEIAL
ncbi:hypothetical protein CAPTEDRAFT_216931 [Capitella teleta]|uniref:C-type lectin domain-containing protein n=1 Tax=Capitella teleta TaxID=283909 RepID=R7VI13_CAPTE|nr:hypothetical protein CAPTEDRAFT_216931 [Capitella teleta]|eukprot:ELU15350.1 hypothetical protein CAPTEDRAFT_216931 [Capitella teleta]